MRFRNESGLIFSIFGLLALELVIQAKIKATALEPLSTDFFAIFLARSRVFGRDYHLKKFHQLLRPLSAQNSCCATNCGEGRLFLWHSFCLSAFISHRKCPNFPDLLFYNDQCLQYTRLVSYKTKIFFGKILEKLKEVCRFLVPNSVDPMYSLNNMSFQTFFLQFWL